MCRFLWRTNGSSPLKQKQVRLQVYSESTFRNSDETRKKISKMKQR